MKKITINTSKQYDILIDDGIISDIPLLIEPFCKTKKILIVTDDIVDNIYGKAVAQNLGDAGYGVFKFVFPNGEKSKNPNILFNILEYALSKQFTKNDLFLALGGGVVGDITGLASALYMRGVGFVSVPTTLLSAVDSSVGGKTAVDLKGGKNCAGAFKQPSLVIIDTEIIKNLPENIFCEGMGEVIKCAVIKDLPLFDYIDNKTVSDNLNSIIYDCLILKKEIVEKDEFDTKGIRNLLNAGHTIGHSIELNSEYGIPHGKAVAVGLYIESLIALKLGLCDASLTETVKGAITSFGLYEKPDFTPLCLANGCLSDKKNRDGKVLFLLPTGIGKLKEVLLSPEKIEEILENLNF